MTCNIFPFVINLRCLTNINHVCCSSDNTIHLDDKGQTTFILAYREDTANIFTCKQNPNTNLARFLRLHLQEDMRLPPDNLDSVNLFFGVKIISKGPAENREFWQTPPNNYTINDVLRTAKLHPDNDLPVIELILA